MNKKERMLVCVWDFDGTLLNLGTDYDGLKSVLGIGESCGLFDGVINLDRVDVENTWMLYEMFGACLSDIVSVKLLDMYNRCDLKIIVTNNSRPCVLTGLMLHDIRVPDLLISREDYEWGCGKTFGDNVLNLLAGYKIDFVVGDSLSDELLSVKLGCDYLAVSTFLCDNIEASF